MIFIQSGKRILMALLIARKPIDFHSLGSPFDKITRQEKIKDSMAPRTSVTNLKLPKSNHKTQVDS